MFAALGGFSTFFLSFVRPLEYSAHTRLLILQKGPGTTDAYTALKAIEAIGENLSQITETTSFFELVMQTDPRIRAAAFPKDEVRRRKAWAKMVDTVSARGSGFLYVTVYHADKREARKIVEAVSTVLVTRGWEYANANIEIKPVDAPLVSPFPARPQFALNALAGGCMGALIGAWYGMSRRSRAHHRRIVQKKDQDGDSELDESELSF